jgi:hypothetical protein
VGGSVSEERTAPASLIAETGLSRRRLDIFAFSALAVHLTLVLCLRAAAWPEVTTTGYLWSRGLMMYRDIKFQHTPGLMGLLALAFLPFGPSTLILRFFSTAPPLLAHVFLLRETRESPAVVRALASAFFLVSFLVSDGNAVWPTVVMSALALPIAVLLSRRRMVAAGLLIGVAILLKQTAAYLLLLAFILLLARRRRRDALILFLSGSAVYLTVLGLFALFGSARDMLRWTIEVPFTIRPDLSSVLPGFVTFEMVLAGFLPLAVEAVLERPGEYKTSGRWLLVVAAGLILIAVPRFDMLQTVGAVPCLAVGAARLMRRSPPLLSRLAVLFVANFALFRGVVLVSGSYFDGRVLYWNEEDSFNVLVDELRRLPPTTALHSKLWGNVLPRTGLLPPGRIYVHPWFDWFFPVDRVGELIANAARAPGTVIVDRRGPGVPGRRMGPYSIFTVPSAASSTESGTADARSPGGLARP